MKLGGTGTRWGLWLRANKRIRGKNTNLVAEDDGEVGRVCANFGPRHDVGTSSSPTG